MGILYSPDKPFRSLKPAGFSNRVYPLADDVSPGPPKGAYPVTATSRDLEYLFQSFTCVKIEYILYQIKNFYAEKRYRISSFNPKRLK